jgi:hypothetical protein
MRQNLNNRYYVDKSMILAELNQLVNSDQKFVCISRARRFGKTMAGNMIAAYYSKTAESKDLFSKLQISGDPAHVEKI